ncbi:MAG TPA: L,D-transpeptidase family protein [Stellaceae bacterium]|nr:L,D-transpeptidase family protein [Stellaceae bacterium]
MNFRLPVFVTALSLAAVLTTAPAWSNGSRISAAIRGLVAAESVGDSSVSGALRQFYDARNDVPAWVDDSKRLAALMAILADAPQQGLAFPVANSLVTGGPATAAARDVALTRLALGYATALALGRVRPEDFETDWAIPGRAFDAAAGLNRALEGDLAAWYAGLPPDETAYRRLVAALARYRKIAASGGWASVPRGVPLKLGMEDPRVPLLRRRLEAEGDLREAAAPAAAVATAPAGDPNTVFDDTLEAAVKRFQSRHGIAVDGTVGPRTLAAMNVPVRARVGQIELNLERWRSLPHDFGARFMMVNVPAERLTIVDHDVPVITMKVVVGDPKHPTPVMRTSMVAVTLNPTWTIPTSIVTQDLLPKSRRHPDYLLKNDIVFTPGRGWQQMPGPKNPLGRIKFESPNRFDVYLHDTPSRFVFDHYFRAQSHGCVRLERADEVADFVLQRTGWTPPELTAAVASGATLHIQLKRRWPVYLVYATSFVDEDGAVEFRDDLYGRDARLRAALAAARQKRDGIARRMPPGATLGHS